MTKGKESKREKKKKGVNLRGAGEYKIKNEHAILLIFGANWCDEGKDTRIYL